MDSQTGYLQGQLLIATPNITGSSFKKSVILVCAHSHEGAMGIIVNHLLDNIHGQDLFDQLSIKPEKDHAKMPIHYGGPVEINRGFVIYEHNGAFLDDAMLTIEGVAISSSINVLQAIAAGKGPEKHLVALGYAGWAPGQLEGEVEENSWISVPLRSDLIFDHKNGEKWKRAAMLEGVDLSKLSTTAGHA